MREARCFNSFHSWGANVVIKLGQWKPRKKNPTYLRIGIFFKRTFSVQSSQACTCAMWPGNTSLLSWRGSLVLIFLPLNPFGIERGTSANEMETRKWWKAEANYEESLTRCPAYSLTCKDLLKGFKGSNSPFMPIFFSAFRSCPLDQREETSSLNGIDHQALTLQVKWNKYLKLLKPLRHHCILLHQSCKGTTQLLFI